MTLINFGFVVVLSGLLAVGSWGIGRWTFRMPPAASQVRMVAPIPDELRYKGAGYPTRQRRSGNDEGMGKADITGANMMLRQVHDAYDKLGGKVPDLAAWDEVVKEPDKLTGVVAALQKPAPPAAEDRLSEQLRQQLAEPETAFKVAPLPADFIAKLLVPRKDDDFYVMVDGKEVDFVWLAKAGCWFATEQSADKPGKVKLEGVGDIPCQSPTEQQWLEAATVAAIRDFADKKAEYLRNNKVIGKSYRVQDDEYTKPMDEAARKKKTLNKSVIPITPNTAEVVRYMEEWKKQNPGKSQAAYNAERLDFMRELSEETFAYRWVIEPPLPQAP